MNKNTYLYLLIAVLILVVIAVLFTKSQSEDVETFRGPRMIRGRHCATGGKFCFNDTPETCEDIHNHCVHYNTKNRPPWIKNRSAQSGRRKTAIKKCKQKMNEHCKDVQLNPIDNFIKGYLDHEFTIGMGGGKREKNSELPMNPSHNGEFCRRGAGLDACRLSKEFRKNCQRYCTKTGPRNSINPGGSGFMSNNYKLKNGSINEDKIRTMEVGDEDPCICRFSGSNAYCKVNRNVRDKTNTCKRKFYEAHKDKSYDVIGPLSYYGNRVPCNNDQSGSAVCLNEKQRSGTAFSFDGVTPAISDECSNPPYDNTGPACDLNVE